MSANRPFTRRLLQPGYTLVEILIVVMILAILAMAVVPKYAAASDDAREAQLQTDVQILRKQIELYVVQHGGYGPDVNEKGEPDRNNFIRRLTEPTTPEGALDKGGTVGPYLKEFPANPFAPESLATTIQFAKAAKPTRKDRAGWYYSTDTRILSPATKKGALNLDPK